MLWIILGIIIVGLLIIISAFFSSAEMAFISINRAIILDKAGQGDKRAKILEKLLQTPDQVISAIVICNNLINILASILAGALATLVFGEIGIGIATAIMFFLVIIFGESTPKAFGLHNETLALRVARSLLFITRLFLPVTRMLAVISNKLIHFVDDTHKRRISVVTEREIMAMLRLGESQGTIHKDEREMVNEVFEFDETRVHEIYVPKENIISIHEDAPIKELIEKAIKTGFSRFPMYNKMGNDVIGMVHVKDTLLIKDDALPVKTITRPILKIDARMKADDALREMKRMKTHLALLLDKNGQIIGLVSMEDLIEEIFGEIADEHDKKN